METVAPFTEVVDEIEEAGGGVFRLCYQCGKCDVVCPWNKVRAFSMRKLIRQAEFGLTEIEGGSLALYDLRQLPGTVPAGSETD